MHLPAIKDEADLVTKGARGAGVAELIEAVLKDDVDAFHSSETHNSVEVGVDADGRPIVIRPHGGSALICGSSGGGKSTVATALLERNCRRRLSGLRVRSGRRLCRVSLGRRVRRREGCAQPAEFVKLLERPEDSFVINMLAVPFEDRPALLSDFISPIANLRAKIGRPHWVLMDEAHHLLPAERDVSATASLESLPPVILVTVDPATLAVERVADSR